MRDRRTRGSEPVGRIAWPVLAALSIGVHGSAQSVVAFDCEPNPFLPFGETYRGLRDGLDINDGGCVVFADMNGVYVINAAGGKAACAFTGLVVSRGTVVGTDFGGAPNSLEVPRHLQRINEDGCVAFTATVCPATCDLPWLSCGENVSPCPAVTCGTPAVIRGRASGPANCTLATLFLQTNQKVSDVLDLDMLETPVLSSIPPGSIEYRAIAALGHSNVLPNQIAFLGPAAKQVTTYVDAVEGGAAPDGSPYPAGAGGAGLLSVTEGDLQPVGFSAETLHPGPESVRIVASELHGSVTSCDSIPGGNDGNTRIDLGCVECFGASDTSVVHYVSRQLEDCDGSGGTRVLVESDVAAGSEAETRMLLQPDTYRTLECGELLSFGERVSGSDTAAVPPRCGRCGVQLGGCETATGLAVFKGVWRPQGGTPRMAIFVATAPRHVFVLVQEGDALPAPHADKAFVSFGDPRVNEAGVAVFWAESDEVACDSEVGGIDNCTGIFRYDLAAFLAGKDLDPCPWDLDRDGLVGITDLLVLNGLLWGTSGPCGDFNHDGTVNITDLLDLLAHWGSCCAPLETKGGPIRFGR